MLRNESKPTMHIILNNGVTNYYDSEHEFGDDKPYESSTAERGTKTFSCKALKIKN